MPPQENFFLDLLRLLLMQSETKFPAIILTTHRARLLQHEESSFFYREKDCCVATAPFWLDGDVHGPCVQKEQLEVQ